MSRPEEGCQVHKGRRCENGLDLDGSSAQRVILTLIVIALIVLLFRRGCPCLIRA
jgi:hypothetical protein